MSGRGSAASRLERAVSAHAACAGVALTIDDIRSTRWASATFVGARHRLVVTIKGVGAHDWLANLAEADLPMPGHLVADLVVVDQRRSGTASTATIEVLTVEAG